MFTTEQRNRVRDRVIEIAQSDPRVTAGAIIGSTALAPGDVWSDIDITFGVTEGTDLSAILDEWTEQITGEFGLVHYWDLRSGPSIYRVLLLPTGLEVDLSVTPQPDFGARGPNFRSLFGPSRQIESSAKPDIRYNIGLGWHHLLHARSSIERGKPWRAAYWIAEARNETLTLACMRLGEEHFHGRGIDRLPASVTDPLKESLVRSLDAPELRRALAAAAACFIAEVERWDPALGTRLGPVLLEDVSH